MNQIQKAAQAINKSTSILITAGAGNGVDSGLPDFRGPQGFWRAYPPLQKLGIRFEEMANPYWFHKNPHLAWGFYGHRLNLYRRTIPHEGFKILLDICKNRNSFVFTSNVDGQFQKAGFPESNIYECHGSIHYTQCLSSHCSSHLKEADFTLSVDEGTLEASEPLPRCHECSSLLRPNILLFGDNSWNEDRSEEQAKRFSKFLEKIKLNEDFVVLELGAGTAVSTVRNTSEQVSSKKNGTLIRINPDDPSLDRGSKWDVSKGIGIAAGALETLTQIKKEMQEFIIGSKVNLDQNLSFLIFISGNNSFNASGTLPLYFINTCGAPY